MSVHVAIEQHMRDQLGDQIEELIGMWGISGVVCSMREVVQHEAGRQSDRDMIRALERLAKELDGVYETAEGAGL